MQFYLVISLVFALLVSIFALQNTEVVTIKFLSMNFDISLVLVILGSAVMGAVTIFLLNMFREVGNWRKLRELQQKVKQLEQKNSELEGVIAMHEAQASDALEAIDFDAKTSEENVEKE